MSRPYEVTAEVKAGHSPRTIAQRLEISQASVVQYLETAVGRGLLSRSEVLFAIDQAIAQVVESLTTQTSIRTLHELKAELAKLRKLLRENHDFDIGIIEEEVLLYFKFREAPLADMYESLCRLETYLHAYIRTELERGFGPLDWWRKGIPEAVRRDCVDAKERDSEPRDDPYCYTTFIHLRDIFNSQWGVFCKLLPKSVAGDKPKFLSDLVQLNGLRNRIMHPVRGYRPTKRDFDFVKDFAARMFAEDASPSA